MRRRALPVAIAVALLATGCRLDGLQFTTDDRVTWITPDRSVVGLPFTLRWELVGYRMTGPDGASAPDAGYVAVFVDRSPQQPFVPLEALADDDTTCAASPTCPDAEWFADRGVHFVESGSSLTIDRLPGIPDDDRREQHDITLVLLDGQGRRQGESAFRLRLEVDRSAPAPEASEGAA